MSDSDDGELGFYDGIVEHENRIILALQRVRDDGLVLDDLGALNINFDDDEVFAEAVEAWVDWLGQASSKHDFYQREYLDDEGVDTSDKPIDDIKRVHPEEVLWVCPDCGSPVDPLGNRDLAERRNDEDWWDNPHEWSDVPAVECTGCGKRYRLRLDPV